MRIVKSIKRNYAASFQTFGFIVVTLLIYVRPDQGMFDCNRSL